MRSGRHDPTAEAPEVVSYLAMSLTASPALDRAMAFAAEHAKGPLAQSLRSALWDVHLRARTRIEEAFLSVADAWGTRNADVKRALYGIAEAVRDGSRTTVTHAVDRARIQVFEGSRRRMREYAASLKAPTTALFALGVLLPLIVSSIVPLLSLGSFSPSAIEVVAEDTGNPLPWIVLLDVGFPLGAFTFAHLVSRRPLTSRGEMRARNALLGFVSIPVAFGLVWAVPGPLVPVVALGVATGGVSLGLLAATRTSVRDWKRRESVEGEFPDAMFQLGSRLQDGHGLEASFLAVAEASRGTECAEVFRRIVHALRFGGGTIADALFGPRGAFEGVASPRVRAGIGLVVDLAEVNPETAGRAAIEMSSYLRDLHGIEEDLRTELRPTTDAMRATATLFAPAVLGVSASLYGVLFAAFGSMAALPMPPTTFAVALGAYLLFTAASILWFTTRVAGRGLDGFGYEVGRTLPIAYLVFVAALMVSGGVP